MTRPQLQILGCKSHTSFLRQKQCRHNLRFTAGKEWACLTPLGRVQETSRFWHVFVPYWSAYVAIINLSHEYYPMLRSMSPSRDSVGGRGSAKRRWCLKYWCKCWHNYWGDTYYQSKNGLYSVFLKLQKS